MTLSPDVVKAVNRLRRLLLTDAQNKATVAAEQWSDEVLRRVRPVITSRAIEKARAHLDAALTQSVVPKETR